MRTDRRFEGRDRGRLGPRDQLVDLEVARRRLADEQRPGHVAPVARDLGPEVEQEDRPGPDRAVARGAVRQRRLGTGQAGDVEGERLGAAGAHQPFEPQREVGLGRVRSGSRAAASASARSATAQAAAMRSISAGSLTARSASSQPSTGTSSTSGAAAARRSQMACGTNPASTATRRAPTDAISSGQRARQVVVGLDDAGLGRLARGLDRVARVGQDRDVVAADQELARVAGDLLLAVGEGEAGQVAHVLASDAEVGVDAGCREPGAQARQPSRPGGPVRLGPRSRSAADGGGAKSAGTGHARAPVRGLTASA